MMEVLEKLIEIKTDLPKGKVLDGLSLDGIKIEKPSTSERKQIPLFRTLHGIITGSLNPEAAPIANNQEKMPQNERNDSQIGALLKVVGGNLKDSAAKLKVRPPHTDSLVSAAEERNIIIGDDPKAA